MIFMSAEQRRLIYIHMGIFRHIYIHDIDICS